MNLGEIILDRYKEYLGQYIGADLYSNDECEIQLLGFPEAVENCLVFSTLGLSKYSDFINNECEILLAVNEAYDECANVFMNSVFYILSNKMNFGRGVLIEGTDSIVKDFSAKHDKSAIYFTDVYILPEEFSVISDSCKVYMGFFVTKQEAEYIKQYGCEKFEDKLEEADCDVIDLNRKSVV